MTNRLESRRRMRMTATTTAKNPTQTLIQALALLPLPSPFSSLSLRSKSGEEWKSRDQIGLKRVAQNSGSGISTVWTRASTVCHTVEPYRRAQRLQNPGALYGIWGNLYGIPHTVEHTVERVQTMQNGSSTAREKGLRHKTP